jgi:hypothetical protein
MALVNRPLGLLLVPKRRSKFFDNRKIAFDDSRLKNSAWLLIKI